ncbi:bifunctional DedA family/phosphatase PAP2 family protein [Rhodobacter ferrooxidans]|uniref:Phosphoesterase PA-phosphatase related protein n=1 Tax=Rhodobacter ferrooxidans TaxID=371731 RepID=C8S1X3_9RHOB|nr:bifunctional DedA family/phosphatase PAP2 family protein [Rhodobacter sp. SW2]EEW25071.1 phosphoesterase PA-phosphatase related protein [Rhodobacter sp. SW2]
MMQWLTHFVDFLGAHQALAILFAFLVSFGEALLIIGLFVPSTVVLVGLGTLIGLGKMALLPVFAATVVGAIAGDALSFWAGVHWKERIRTFWPFSRYATLMEKGEQFIARHGGKSIFIVRFIPGVKAVVPTIAGMMGMTTTRFALVNVGSAFVWAAVHLLPAIALGRGLQVAHAANPRFAILAALGAAAAVLAWLAMRVARGLLIPAADLVRFRLAVWLERRGGRVGAFARVLRNHDGALEATALMGLALGALAGFALLFFAVIFDPEVALADAAIGQFVQGLRTDWATSIMIGITMLGDAGVLFPAALLLITAVLVRRQWAIAVAVATASLSGVVFVDLFKTLLQRSRPIPMYQGADQFSFPSGHSTSATITFGMLALFVAQALPARFRGLVYGCFATLIALIGLSRVYLQAHWPSDVLAGMLFGGAVVSVVALLLHARVVTFPLRMFAAMLIVIGLGIMPLHVWTGWSAAVARYDAILPVTTLAAGDWLATGWQKQPTHRVLLDGDPGEPMLVQTTWPIADLVNDFEAVGWQPSQNTLSGEILSAIVPSRLPLTDHAPWPMTHLGRTALATLTKMDGTDQRLVLRIWATQTLVQNRTSKYPLLMVSLTADRLDPVAFGYAQLEEASIVPDQLATEKAGLAAALPQAVGEPSRIVDLPPVAE